MLLKILVFCCGLQATAYVAFFSMIMVQDKKEQTINLFEKFTDSDSLVNKCCNIVSHKLKSDEIQYNIQFLLF